jgi:hypothetical protein
VTNEIDPVTLTLMVIYNSVILAMILKWFIPEMRKIREAVR